MKIHSLPDTIPKLYRLRSQLTPMEPAFHIHSLDGHWHPQTWAEFWQEIRSAAGRLHALGVRRGHRVAILMTTCKNWEILQQAIMFLGGVVVGIDPTACTDEIRSIVEHSQTKLVITARRDGPTLTDLLRDGVQVIVVGETVNQRAKDLIYWERVPGIDSFNVSHDDVDFAASEDIATIIHTSGTTGRARAIEVSHGKLLIACQSLVETYRELEHGDTTFCWMPMHALFQRMANLLAVACGMQVYFIDDPRSIVRNVFELAPTFLVGVPRFFEKLEEATHRLDSETAQAWTNRLKYMVSGSAPLIPSVLKSLQARGVLVLEAYGLSENTVPLAANRASCFRFGSVGKPLRTNEIRFRDDGEILVRGPGLFAGYYREKQADSAFTEDGFYQTGDCGRLDDDGFLYLTGRKSELIKTSTGRRTFPTKIEATYLQSRYIDQILVVGDGRKYLAALVVVNEQAVGTFLSEFEGTEQIAEGRLRAALEQLFLSELEKLDQDFAPHERIRALALLREPFSIDRGELTPTFKIRRQVIGARYADTVERIYRERPPCVLLSWNDSDGCVPDELPKQRALR